MNSGPKYSLLEAKQKLEAYCAYQERCELEIRKKLNSWRMYAEDIEILIADLIVNRFLNEERFAEAYVSGKTNIKRWGRIKIKQELKLRKISDYSINKAINAIDSEVYWNNLLHLTEKKIALTKEKDSYKKRAKVYSFLASKGYETDLIKEAYQEILKAH